MKTILITEDKLEVRELIKVTLRIGDYKLLEASNGMQAVEMAREHTPDLILMDIMMPGTIDGLEATRLIKSDPQTRRCKIIMLTAKGQQQDVIAGKEAGADAYFIKPFSPLELIQQVELQLQQEASWDTETLTAP
ncbi:response regulator [Desulfovibrio mangrovi]|uniref:response regulator transcription factor n=1 Tax=Desulfovibrio mangrovi TaxID=2976983 RepID=UPI00224530C6|nr:response regulator [Desulfovibrio mangrovi]UZP65961.1 response regulator [Desulfovibrio mangrovi]